MTHSNIIIFTDLDGCLLDHNQYSFSLAKPLLQKLKQYEIPLIINSSKTKLEIETIQKEMGIETPYIIENGAAVIFNPVHEKDYFNIDTNTLEQLDGNAIQKFALSRDELLLIANKIKKQHNFKYKGFNDMSVSQISELTNLSSDAAFAASQRGFSEPLLWQDSLSRLIIFKRLLAEKKIRLQEGGRFIHLSGQYSKGKAMQWLLKHWQSNLSLNKTVIALGDSMNDVSMLNKSDYALVIKNKTKKLKVKGLIETIHSSFPGTQGWVETLTPLLNHLIQPQGKAHG